MEFRDIEYFTAVAQHGHLGRAAESLGLSQPALSKSQRRLEHELGAKLVKRTPKGVELSAEGHALVTRARELRLSVQNIAQEIKDVSRGGVGFVRVGTGPTSSAEMLLDALLPLLTDAPRIEFNIIVSDNDLMIPALRRGELDLIFGYLREGAAARGSGGGAVVRGGIHGHFLSDTSFGRSQKRHPWRSCERAMGARLVESISATALATHLSRARIATPTRGTRDTVAAVEASDSRFIKPA
jgi:DNA-binding transcriptional LysR family regulator